MTLLVASEQRAPTNRIATMFIICSYGDMERIEQKELAAILLAAPGWARVGLTMPDPRLRERAADTLAATIIEKLRREALPDINQFRLPL
ncbi:DUF6771 family protein [Sphingomonas sp. CL5.1]|uniref:DUF6771 family protein n=1 Tax=Sphingomonas sp. CL5.1 TaxID=2653203 RepID=UPI0020C606B2|nr:DUF6771 family protein [Sphingomonas sp. CL5.1]